MFIYYQGDRYRKENRYYFGAGVIGTINQHDEHSFTAEIEQGYRFKKKVPVYESNENYLESIGKL